LSFFKKIYRSRIFKAALEIAFSFILAFVLLMSLRMALGVENPLFVVSSGSMIPAINIGDIILVQKATPTQVNLGDIVVFRDPYARLKAPIVHRIVDIIVDENGNYKIATAGDAIGSWDQFSPWDASLLIGKVIMRIPYIGNLYLLLYSDNRFIVIIFIIIIFFLALLFFSDDKDKKDSRKKISWSGKNIAYILVINLLLASLLILSLWGRGTNFLGMFEEYRLNAKKYGDENVSLLIGFMTYRIDCLVHGSVRQGALTFSWTQFLLLILILFNIVKVLIPVIRPHLLKDE